MRKWAIGLVVAMGTTMWPAAAGASPPRHIKQPVDFTFLDPYYTPFCGFDVVFSLKGTFNSTLFVDHAGLIVREFDDQPATTETYSAPDSGKSFSFRFTTSLHAEYPGGARIGGPAIIKGTGFVGKVPGLPADAGIVTFDHGVVFDINPDGVPIFDLGPVTSQHGHSNDLSAIDDAICAALAP